MQTQDLSQYYLITVPANVNVMVLSVLLIVTGGAMIATCICQIGTAKAMDSTHDKHRSFANAYNSIDNCNMIVQCFACLCILTDAHAATDIKAKPNACSSE